ncbi:unnamed protein product [Schistosoma mattheei]|uniref:Uncharacterized protein n=1 Tax=Schistosoma mattheei TaxID=31246 RepID=A0A183PLY5_9TREM|nr:unnamed protein product [Schistosoma mattheei]
MMIAKMKLKLNKHCRAGETVVQWFNTASLQHTNKIKEFRMILNNRFQVLQNLIKEEEISIDDNWKGTKDATTLTCHTVTGGGNKRYHKEWISIETLDKIQERKKKAAINNSRTRTDKSKPQTGYKETNRQMRKNIRADKQTYIRQYKKLKEKEISNNHKTRRKQQ